MDRKLNYRLWKMWDPRYIGHSPYGSEEFFTASHLQALYMFNVEGNKPFC